MDAVSHNRKAERTTWFLAILLALCFQAFWMVWLRPAPLIPTSRVGTPPHMVYRAVPEQAAQAGHMRSEEVRAVWSPVLFSLPTPVGFSQPMFSDRGSSMRPPLQAPSVSAMFLARPPGAPDAGRAVRRRGAERLVRDILGSPALVPDGVTDVALFRKEPAGRGLSIRFNEGLSEVVFTDHRLPASCLSTQAWSLTAFLELDPRGFVARALLEDISDDALRADMVRAICQWQAAPSDRIRSGRVIMSYDGVLPTAITGETAP
ncbi:MAG: hypothetical protein EOM20_10285 [Spartobacteria bacterium]|nr:hypothetical protein [Spartobacteria bacterium]